MNIHEYKDNLCKRVGKEAAIDILDKTIKLWEFKKSIQIDENGSLEKCNRSIIYFKKLKSIMENDFYCRDECISIAQETGDPIIKCKSQCLKCINEIA